MRKGQKKENNNNKKRSRKYEKQQNTCNKITILENFSIRLRAHNRFHDNNVAAAVESFPLCGKMRIIEMKNKG